MIFMNYPAALLPYCLMREPDGRYVAVNRRYKPLGFLVEKWMDYGHFPIAADIGPMTPQRAAKLSYNGSTDIERIFLYSSSAPPWSSTEALKAYGERLALLSDISITIGEEHR